MSETTDSARLPRPVIRRLIQYLRHAKLERLAGNQWTSSKQMANQLGLTSSTVRQDLSYLNVTGIPRNGYDLAELEEVLSNRLNAGSSNDLVLVGAGNLGRAIAQHGGLSRHGYRLRAVYDKNPEIVGKTFGDQSVRCITRASTEISANGWQFAMLAVPAESAQELADYLINAGIRGILNLSLAHISVSPPVQVVDTRLMDSLQELVFSVTEAYQP
jgi:redox-sensing transcriptional repressor